MPTTSIVQTSTTTTSIHLQWTRGGGDNFTLYYWKTSTPSNVSTVTTTSLSYNITGLDSNTAYKVIVSARTSLGSANSSEVVGYTTPEGTNVCSKQSITATLYYVYRYIGIISISYLTHLCLIHTAPGLIARTPLSSTSINVRWSPPPNSDRSPLTYHVNYTGMSRSTSDTTLTLTGLHPYEEYTISVQAGNKGGLSVPVTGTARTYSDSELVVWTCVV